MKHKLTMINFSSRDQKGNGYSISNYINEKVNMINKDFEVNSFQYHDLTIHSCGTCDYECFKHEQGCPFLDDDIKDLYDSILTSDICFFIIPIYSDFPCSNFFIFRERSQCIFYNEELYQQYLKVKKGFIIIGNTGLKETELILQHDFKEHLNINYIINLKSSDVGERSIKGNLVSYQTILNQIDILINDIFEEFVLS